MWSVVGRNVVMSIPIYMYISYTVTVMNVTRDAAHDTV